MTYTVTCPDSLHAAILAEVAQYNQNNPQTPVTPNDRLSQIVRAWAEQQQRDQDAAHARRLGRAFGRASAAQQRAVETLLGV